MSQNQHAIPTPDMREEPVDVDSLRRARELPVGMEVADAKLPTASVQRHRCWSRRNV
jgi:hypothetical protein